jgi:hypothetical protein
MVPKAGRRNKAMSQSENIDEVPHPFTSPDFKTAPLVRKACSCLPQK